MGEDTEITDRVVVEENDIGRRAGSEIRVAARGGEGRSRDGIHDLTIGQPVLTEPHRLGNHVGRCSHEVGPGQNVNSGLDGQRKQTPHVRQTLHEQPAAARRLTQLGEGCLDSQNGRHPHPISLSQCRKVVLGEKQSMLDGVDAGGNRERRYPSGHGVDRHARTTVLGCRHRPA